MCKHICSQVLSYVCVVGGSGVIVVSTVILYVVDREHINV